MGVPTKVNKTAANTVFVVNMPAYYPGMSRLGMLVCAAAIGCGGGPKRVHKPGEEYLAGVKLEGNRAIGDDKLKSGLALMRAIGRGVDDYQVTADTTRIAGAYQRLGYFTVDVKSHVVRTGDATTVVFTIAEGPRATARVEISGLPPEVSADQARALVKLSDGAPFDYMPFDNAKTPLLALVEDAGYAHAQLDAAVLADRTTNQATLRFAIDAGPRVQFGPVTVTGVTGALADAARERTTFEPGDWYSARELAATQQAIYGIRRFSTVRIDIDRMSEALVLPVKISLAEAKRLELRLGGGAGLDLLTYQIRGRAVLTYAGWPTPLTTLGVEFRPAYTALRDNCDFYKVWACEYEPRVRLLGTVTQQDLFRRDLKGEVGGGLDYLKLEAYTTEGARARLGLSSPLGTPKLEAQIGWLFAYYDFPESDISPVIDAAKQAELGIDHVERLGAFTQGIALDLRDNPIEPKLGAYAELRLAEGGSYAGGAYHYLQVSPDVRGYVPFSRFVIAARARLGVISGDVPPTERYYAGGASSQRGFSERRLSPTVYGLDKDGKPISVVIGGAGLIETGLELRTHFELFGITMGGVVFLDGGDVTEAPSDLDVTNLHWAVGFGIRPYYLPIGPIRIEIAYRLNRRGPGEPSPGDWFALQIGVGEAY